MKKITKKVILNTAKETLNNIVDQLQLEPTRKTKKLIDKIAVKLTSTLKNEVVKQTKEKQKAEKAMSKSKKKTKKVISV